MKIFFTALIVINFNLVTVGQNLVQLEYFLDVDAGVGRNSVIDLTSIPEGSFPFAVNVSALAPGYHQLYIRTRDNNGVWSHTTRKYIEVVPVQTKNTLAGGEYFFDQDPGVGNALSITVSAQDSIVMQNFAAAVSGLLPGSHKLYTRFKDSYGKWSQTSRSTIEIVPVDDKDKVVNGEYFFDADPGFGKAYILPASIPDTGITQSFTAAVSGLTPGSHTFYSRLMDSYGKWSQTLRRTVEVIKNPDTNYVATLEYFFSREPGFGNAVPIQLPVAAQNGTFSFNVATQNVTSRNDTLFFRVKDSSAQNWSFTRWMPVVTDGPLPLTLLNFTAAKQDQEVLLNWQTENEVNTSYFAVERSLDGRNFSSIGKLNAQGNNIARSSYSYKDNTTGIEVSKLYYRLRQVDNDGKITYSDIAVVLLESKVQFVVTPNPASDYIIVTPGAGLQYTGASLLITDIAGHTIFKQEIINSGSQKISISSFAKGVYAISIVSPGVIQTRKLIIK